MTRSPSGSVGRLGEFELIARIERLFGAASRGPGVVLGIGDDAALLRARPGEDVVVTTDALVEDVHFRWRTDSAASIGRRALAVNLSDLAAMGARPLGCTLALAVPPRLALRTLDAVMRGLAAEAREQRCPLVGGNVTRAQETSFAVTALGAVKRGRALRRDAARAGDRLCVTGSLGGASLARARAERRGTRQPAIRSAPQPRLAAGRALARLRNPGACIDVSDGLVADLRHLLAASSVGARLDWAAVPRARGFGAACGRLGLDADALLAGGGGDYELLFSVRPGAPSAALLSRRLGVVVTEIGRLEAQGGLRGLPPSAGGKRGWRHF